MIDIIQPQKQSHCADDDVGQRTPMGAQRAWAVYPTQSDSDPCTSAVLCGLALPVPVRTGPSV